MEGRIAETRVGRGQTLQVQARTMALDASMLRRDIPLADPAIRDLVKMYNAHRGMVQPPSSENRLSELFDPI